MPTITWHLVFEIYLLVMAAIGCVTFGQWIATPISAFLKARRAHRRLAVLHAQTAEIEAQYGRIANDNHNRGNSNA